MGDSKFGSCLEKARSNISKDLRIDIIPASQELENESKRHQISRSFISDTITVPTIEMYQYAMKASLGDDVYEEQTTSAFEAHVALISGKEAALFLPSGSMSNQIALRTHLKQPPYSILCDHRAHIHRYEAGGAAFHSGAALTTVVPSNGHHLTLDDIKQNVILGDDVHIAPTEVIALENTLNGTIIPQEDVIAICDFAHKHGIKAHLDGARIWHVAAEKGISLRELCEPFDSISMCFSKGLGAPVGTCLVGTKVFIKKARWLRKLFGGGMRQTGILAASAAYALSNNFTKLVKVHELTRRLESGLKEIGIKITSPAETCMVFFDPSSVGISLADIEEGASLLQDPLTISGPRLVVHIQTSEEAVDDLLTVIRDLAQSRKDYPDFETWRSRSIKGEASSKISTYH